MKEATGELNMTVVTVVAIAAVGAFFYAFVWPGIQAGMMKNTCANLCPPAAENNKLSARKEGDNFVCVCGDAAGTTYKVDKDGNMVDE